MNGPQHYAEAERLLKVARATEIRTSDPNAALRASFLAANIAEAQVHATLALVATRVRVTETDGHGTRQVHSDWSAVITP